MKTEHKSVYVGLDVMKLLCALLVVYLHTYNHDWGTIGEWIHVNLSPIGVPFFFIVSGFLYMGKLRDSKDKPKDYFLHYLKRVAYMYIFWSVITLPVAWMNIESAHAEYGFLMKLLYIIRCLFFTGSIGIYWYILALVYNSIILFYAMKWHKMKLLYVLSCVFFILGVLYDGGILRETLYGKIIHVVFGSERNFFNVGLFYMCVGAFMVECKIKWNKYVLCLLLLMCLMKSSYMHVVSSYRIMQAPLAILLFIFALQLKFTFSTVVSLKLRQWSTALYLGHFPFILCFDYYLRRGSIIDVPISIIFSLATFYVITKLSPNKLAKIAYG